MNTNAQEHVVFLYKKRDSGLFQSSQSFILSLTYCSRATPYLTPPGAPDEGWTIRIPSPCIPQAIWASLFKRTNLSLQLSCASRVITFTFRAAQDPLGCRCAGISSCSSALSHYHAGEGITPNYPDPNYVTGSTINPGVPSLSNPNHPNASHFLPRRRSSNNNNNNHCETTRMREEDVEEDRVDWRETEGGSKNQWWLGCDSLRLEREFMRQKM